MNDTSKIENVRNIVIKDIKCNNIKDLKKCIEIYNINLNEINDKEFDILIFSIENNAKVEVIEFIINCCQYKTLNYSFYCEKGYTKYISVPVGQDICYRGYKIPLFSAIAKKEFKIADVLIKYKADINYRLKLLNWEDIHIIHYLYHIGRAFIDKDILKYILSHGFINLHLTTDSIRYFMDIDEWSLNFLFNYYVFNTSFILDMLYCYKFQKSLTNQQFQAIIVKEKSKIKIDKDCYKDAIDQKKYNQIILFLDYDSNTDNMSFSDCYRLLEEAIYLNHTMLVKSILNHKIKNNLRTFLDETTCNVNDENENCFEKFIRESIENNNIDILKLLIEILLLNYDILDFGKWIHFEKVLLEANKKNNKEILMQIFKLLLLTELLVKGRNYTTFVHFILNSESSSFKEFSHNDLSNALVNIGQIIIQKYDTLYFNLIINTLIKIEKLDWIQCLLENDQLKTKININTMDRNEECPLMVAFYTNNIEIFNYLINYGADYNIIVREKENCEEEEAKSLFSLALQKKYYGMLNILLKHDIKISKHDVNENYPLDLIEAIFQNNSHDIETICINKGNYHKNNYFLTSGCCFSPLVLSYLLNYQKIFEILIRYCDINELDHYGYSILHYSILREDIVTTHHLINCGAEINYIDNINGRGNSALNIAIHIKNQEILSELINNEKIKLDLSNEQGETLIVTLIKCQNYTQEEKLDLIENLISKGSNANTVDEEGYTPLIYAIQMNSLPIIKLLIKYGSNVNFIIKNYQEDFTQSVLMYALKLNSKPIIKFLIEHQASFDSSNENEMIYLNKILKSRNTEL